MHHLSGFFAHKKKIRYMNPKNRVRPRLERRNAAKNIDYDASSFLSSLEDSSPSSLVTRSLNFPDRTSFRIEGTEGEFELIYRSLGISGPDDFAIPADEWEAMKLRSASGILPQSRIITPRSTEIEREEVEEVKESTSVRVLTAELTRCDLTESTCLGVVCNTAGGGIKGTRPPVLKPPPSMRLPAIDSTRTTWEVPSDSAPERDRGSESVVSSIKDFCYEERRGNRQMIDEHVLRITDGVVLLSESCSFTTSNDDDSSSTTTEPMSTTSPNGRLRRTITTWQKGDHLGSGSFGSVYEGISEDGFFFALKEVSLLDQGSQGKQSIYQLEQEIVLLSQFEHENIVRYLGTDKDESKLYIFLELVTKGSLQKLYQRYHLRDSQVSAYTRQILHGLVYLHDRNVVHRDIKCANILVDASGSVKLADFGLAKLTKSNDVKSCKGTAFWMAPEVINGKNQGYGLPADIWSLGCTVLEMLTHQIPYYPLEWMQALFRIGRGLPPPLPDCLSEDALDFVKLCLQANPNARPTAVQLLDHPFVKRPLPTYSVPSSPYVARRS